MKVYYALYDQSYENKAQYWTWFPDELTRQMRDAIASKSGAFQMRPKRPNLLNTPDIVGGIINYQDEWCVVYRFFNGGNDPQGRPDRCVLATAWVKREEALGQNLYELLFSNVFLTIQKLALNHCPVQAPKRLVEEVNIPVRENDPQLKIYYANPEIENWPYKDPVETEVIGKLFPQLIESSLIKSLQVLQSSAYMETFSGTPLSSGVTCTPRPVELPPEPELEPEPVYNPYDNPFQFNTYTSVVFSVFLVSVCLFTAWTFLKKRPPATQFDPTPIIESIHHQAFDPNDYLPSNQNMDSETHYSIWNNQPSNQDSDHSYLNHYYEVDPNRDYENRKSRLIKNFVKNYYQDQANKPSDERHE